MSELTNDIKLKKCTKCKNEKPGDHFITKNKICNTCDSCREIDRQRLQTKKDIIAKTKNDKTMICLECKLEKEIDEFKRGNKTFQTCRLCRESNNIYNKNLFNDIKQKVQQELKDGNEICRVCNKQKDKSCFIENGIQYKTCIDCINNMREVEDKYFIIKNSKCKPNHKICIHCREEKILDQFIGKYKEETCICIDCKNNIKIYLDENNANCDGYHKFCISCKLQKPLNKFIGIYKEENSVCSDCQNKGKVIKKLQTQKTYQKFIENKNDLFKVCFTCAELKPKEEFIFRNKEYNNCISCRKYKAEKKIASRVKNPEKHKENASRYEKNNKEKIKKRKLIHSINNIEYVLLNRTKTNAKEKKLEFNLTLEHILDILPKDNKCPILKENFVFGNGHCEKLGLSVDRINPNIGYIVGNVNIISYMANRIKSNLSLTQLENLLYNFMNYKNNIHNIDNITRKIIIQDRVVLIENNNYKQNIKYRKTSNNGC